MRREQAGFIRTSDQKNIYYEDYGEGETIVIVPGFLCTTKFFRKNVEALSADHRLVILDTRGHGYSSKSPCGMTIDRMACDVKELMEQLGLENVVLTGWSLGGNIVMSYYEQFGKEHLKALAILDSTLFPYGEEETNAHALRGYNLEGFCNLMKKACRDYEGYCREFAGALFKNPITPEDEAWIVNEAMKCPVWAAFSMYEDFLHRNFVKVIPQVEIPMLFCCANSPRTPKGVEMSRSYVELARTDCSFHEFKGGGHILFYECPEEFHEVMGAFMDHLRDNR